MELQCIEINGRQSQKYCFAPVNPEGGVQWECSALKPMEGGVKNSNFIREIWKEEFNGGAVWKFFV